MSDMIEAERQRQDRVWRDPRATKMCASCERLYIKPTTKRSPCCGDCWYDPATMSEITETEGVSETTVTLVSVVGMAWLVALGLTLLWWNDLGVERFEQFVGRVIVVAVVTLGLTATVIVGALVVALERRR